eukprot:2478299-Amphidinium_carterae.1
MPLRSQLSAVVRSGDECSVVRTCGGSKRGFQNGHIRSSGWLHISASHCHSRRPRATVSCAVLCMLSVVGVSEGLECRLGAKLLACFHPVLRDLEGA